MCVTISSCCCICSCGSAGSYISSSSSSFSPFPSLNDVELRTPFSTLYILWQSHTFIQWVLTFDICSVTFALAVPCQVASQAIPRFVRQNEQRQTVIFVHCIFKYIVYKNAKYTCFFYMLLHWCPWIWISVSSSWFCYYLLAIVITVVYNYIYNSKWIFNNKNSKWWM